MKENIHGNEWLDVKKFPEIRFVLTKLQRSARNGCIIWPKLTAK